jgi:hypothetical protein
MRFDVTHSALRSSVAVAIALLTACSGTGKESTGPGSAIAGSWSTQGGAQTTLRVQLLAAESSLSGTGTVTVPALAPTSGPATPAYTGDNFTITSGSFNSPNVSFIATLGANPNGAGGFFVGTLSFSGTVSGSTMQGTLTFTPPRTVTQTFAGQTVTGATLTKP